MQEVIALKAAIYWAWALGLVASTFYVASVVFQVLGMIVLSAGVALAGAAVVMSMLVAGALL